MKKTLTLFPRVVAASASAFCLLLSIIPATQAQNADDAHYFSGGVRVDLRADPAWIAVKSDPGNATANVRAGIRKRLPIRAGGEGIENTAAGVVVEAVELRGARFGTRKAIRDEAIATAGVKRTLRTFHNGKLAPIVETGEICVRFSPEIGQDEVVQRLAAVGAKIISPLGDYAPNGYLAAVGDDSDAFAAANELYGKPGVIYSHPNLIRPKEKAFVPNDPSYNQQWHLNNTGSNGTTGGTSGQDIKAERAWEITRGSSSVIVAVLDDGFDIGHEDFSSANKIAPGYDFLSNDSNPRPARTSDNHGTACAGLAVADGNNGIGVSGVAPNCRLMPIRMLGGQTDSAEAAAFNHAKNNGAAVLSCSYSYPLDGSNTFIPLSDVISNAITDAADNGRGGKGCVIVFAAGNDNRNADLSGYNIHPKVITVAASTNQGVKSSYSNFGSSIALTAPGGPQAGDMMTVDRTGNSGYTTGNYESAFNGTSAATPVVAGVAALLLSKEPNLTRSQVRQRLIDSADFIGGVTYDENGHHNSYGFGRVNAWAALTWNDSTDPTIAIRVPGQGLSTTNLAAADGTVSDVGTGIYQVQIAISDSQNRWWNWGNSGWSAPNSYIGTLDYHLKLATVNSGNWTISLPNLGAGSYRIHAKAIDHADNDSEFAFADFIIDPTGPQVTIGHPVANVNYTSPPTATGTAFDNIQDKRFALFRETDGMWYDWTTSSFTSPIFNGTTHVHIIADTGLNWSLPLSVMDAGRYQLHALVFDSSGRSSDWVRRDFRINLPPLVAVNTPGHTSSLQELIVISGDVTDTSGTGLVGNQVNFTLYQDGSYWTGSTWSAVQTVLHAPINGTSWTFSDLPQGGDVRSGEYFVSAYVVDNTGTTSTPTPGVNQTSFRLDTAPPEVAITAPVTGTTQVTQSYSFAGTASDAGGIERVVLFIRRNVDGRYWNGSGWIVEPLSANLASTYNSGTNTWQSNFSLPQAGSNSETQLANGTYNFIAIAFDHAGNSLQTDSVVTVDYHQVYNWTAGSFSDLNPNNNDFYWGNPANWSPNGIPAAEDVAVIAMGHVVRSTVSRTVHGFHMSLGALDFDNPAHSLTITRTGTWTSGTLEDSVFIEPAATLAISSEAVKQIGGGGVIHNSGAVTWTGPGVLRGYSNSTWNNKPGSSFTMLTDGDVFSNSSSGNVFNNQAGATFIKATGAAEASTYIDEWTINNNGVIDSQQGTLHFYTTLNLNAGSTLAGAGRVLLGGTANLNTALTSTGNPELIGTLNATAASFSGTNPFVWSNGSINGGFTLAAGSVLDLSTGNTKVIGSSSILTNHGRINWRAGLLQGYSNSTLNNESGGVFEAFTDGDIFSNSSSGNVFNNKAGALFLKSTGAAESSSYIDEWTFNNNGAIDVQQGTLHFYTTLNLNAGSTLAGAGRVLLGGTTNLNTALTATSNPELIGTLNATAASFSGTNPFVWSSGVINGNFTLAAGSVLDLATGNTKIIGSSGMLTNHGRINWRAGLLQGYSNSTLNNEAGGIFDAVTDGDIFSNSSSGNVFNNKAGALFIKSGKSAAPDGESFVDEWTFNNSGVIRSDTGILHFHTALNLYSGGSITRSGALAAKVRSTYHFVLTGTTAVSNITFEAGGDWHGNLSPGTSGDGTIATSNGGVFEWTAGTAFNTVNIAAGSTFAISGAAMKQIYGGGVLNNGGIATWTGTGNLQGYSNSTFTNLPGSSFVAATDADFVNSSSGNTFRNMAGASFEKIEGTENNRCDWAFDNNGTMSVSSGAIALNGGGTSSGTFAPSAGGLVQFTGGTHSLITTAAIQGAGKTQVLGGTVSAVNHVNGTSSATTLEIAGGYMTSAPGGSFSAVGTVNWISGTIGGAFNVTSACSMNLSGPAIKQIWAGGVIHNWGNATWTGPGLLQGYSNSTWNNKPGSTFTMLTDGDVFSNSSSGNVFNNEAGATFVKITGAAESSSYIDEWTFNNNGVIDSQQGTLHFYTTLNLNAGSSLAGAGRVLLDGTTNLSAALTSTGNPELIGTLNSTSASFSGTNPFVWSSGVINGGFTLVAGSVLDLSTGNTKVIGSSGILTNHGRINWRAGLLQGYSNSTLNNEAGGIFDAFTDGDIFSNSSSGNVFNNKAGALFIKSGKSAAPDGLSYVDEWTFNNSGVIRSDTGILRFHTALNLNPGGSIARNGALSARVLSSYYFVLTGTTTVSNITFESSSDWHGNLTSGSAGNGTLATQSGGLFEWTGGTAHNTVNLAPGSTFSITGTSIKQIGGGGVLNNGGIATRTGSGALQGYSNSSLVNLPGAVFNDLTEAPFTNSSSGNRFTNSGVLNIGAGTGLSTMHWSFTQTATGAMNIEVAGPDLTEFDRLAMSGGITLGGTLNVTKPNGYAPAVGTTFDFLTSAGRTGTFSNIYAPDFAVDYTGGGATLRVIAAGLSYDDWVLAANLAGPNNLPNDDFDGDGQTNFAEFAFNTDPKSSNAAPQSLTMETIDGQKWLVLNYRRWEDREAAGVTYTPEGSPELVLWDGIGVIDEDNPSAPVIAGSLSRRCRVPVGGAKKFLHIKAQD